MVKKYRIDFSAHTSVVVAVEGDDEVMMEEEAVRIAEDYVYCSGISAQWELDDDGIDDVDDSEEAVNENELL